MSDPNSLISINIIFLSQGIDLLEKISDKEYVHSDPPFFESGVGKHMRHILDHYESLINGWTNKINYDARMRNTEVETSTQKAIAKCRLIINSIQTFQDSSQSLDSKVLVRSNESGEIGETPWSSSSIKRELQFMVSHTVHHYALIAFILKSQNVEVPKNFGVAPSTMRYEQQELVEH